jgi:uncharacterized protein (TIGR02117 family)
MKRLPLRASLIGLLALLASCTNLSVKAPVTAASPAATTIYVIARGWHTELALPAADAVGKLAAFRGDFPGAHWLSFGWGERAFFMARHPSVGEALRSLFPAPSVLLVSGLVHTPRAGEESVPLRVSQSGLVALSHFLWKYVATSARGAPKRLRRGPRAASAFYASDGTYDLFHTCNTWTAAALRAAGLPVTVGGVILAGQVMKQVRALQTVTSQSRGTAPEVTPR